MTSYCGVPQAVGDLYNFDPTFQGIPLGDFYNRDPRVPNVPTDRSWVRQGFDKDEDEDELRQSASPQDTTAWGVVAPESNNLTPERALRGVDDTLPAGKQTYNRNVESETLRLHHSLGREMINSWNDARFNVGGIGYAFDNTSQTGIHWASSPGYKGDAYDPRYNPQIYMRPGVKLAAGFSSIGAVPPGQLPTSLYGST